MPRELSARIRIKEAMLHGAYLAATGEFVQPDDLSEGRLLR